jgi:hypothetical protein
MLPQPALSLLALPSMQPALPLPALLPQPAPPLWRQAMMYSEVPVQVAELQYLPRKG